MGTAVCLDDALIERGFRSTAAHARPARHRPDVILPVCEAGGGACPGPDPDDSAVLPDLVEALG